MLFVLKFLCLILQLVITGLVLHQLWHPYRTRRWVRAWRAFLCASLVLVANRVYALWVEVPPFQVIATAVVCSFLLYGLWALVRLFETELESPLLPPPPPETESQS